MIYAIIEIFPYFRAFAGAFLAEFRNYYYLCVNFTHNIMLGAIIGDIAGSAYEFNPTNDYNFEMFPPEANFTDDTICTMAVADAIVSGSDFGRTLQDWCLRYPSPMGGYGGRFREWVFSPEPRPYGSFGNGSAMRVSPAGEWADTVEEAQDLALRSALPTHNHPDGIAGAVAVATAIFDCRALAESALPLTRENILHKGLGRAITSGRYASCPEDFSVDLAAARNRFDETCQGTVPVAFAIILESSSFEDAIRRAVSLGADADTLAAIVGSIAEHLWPIPPAIQTAALSRLPAEFRTLLTRFATLSPNRP